MAYLKEQTENLEISYPIKAIWEAIPKVLEKLDWKIQEKDDATHCLTVKTKGGFISYASTIKVELSVMDAETTKLYMVAETPVTTITSVADYGRSRERIDQFVVALGKLMTS